jgi:polysaccharide biosynthesis/export protein
MKFDRHPSLIFGLLGWLALTSASVLAQHDASRVRTVSGTSAEIPSNPSTNYRIGPGDVLLIEVAGEPDLKHKVKVAERGTVLLRHISQPLQVAGLTEHEAAELLKQEFLVILKEPQVTVFIEEYNALSATITGAVKEPKRIALTRELRLYDLIGLAGGTTDKAGEVVQLVHTRGTESVETIDLRELFRKPELNRVIRDGDLVNVPEIGVIYVSGNVRKPGAFPLKENVTLTQAIALAGGPDQDSKRKEIRLWRANGPNQTDRTEQIVNLDEIEKNASKDILLRPYDIVLVPEATGKKQARTLIQAFTGGIASALGWGVLR